MTPPEQTRPLVDGAAEELLRLILLSTMEFDGYYSADMRLSDFVQDIALSMDVTTVNADLYCKQILAVLR